MYNIFNCDEWQNYVTENFAHLYDYVVESDGVMLTGMNKPKRDLLNRFLYTLFSKDNVLAGIEYRMLRFRQDCYKVEFTKESMVDFINMLKLDSIVFIHKIIIKEKANYLSVIFNVLSDSHSIETVTTSKQVSQRNFLIDKFLKDNV